jgi:late competence protein required for DNA uptake (superfamily II DNA/RNA helicase)
MYTTYHLNSAEEVNTDLLDSIKATFKSRPITIFVEEDEMELTDEMKKILDERLKENEKDYVSSEESIRQLNQKYGL